MSIRTLIADDEPVARKVLREELELFDDVEVVAEAGDGNSALEQIAKHTPDLVFLDLQMPGLTGLEVVRKLRQGRWLPIIVIVTAYDAYAIQAFEAGAVDYLLKPVGQERLAEALARARRLQGKQAEVAQHLAALQELPDGSGRGRPRKVVGRSGDEYFLLSTDEIYAFQADGDLVWIVTADRKYLATQSLRALEERLRESTFRRVHRSALVNIDHVRKMSTLTSQRWLLTLNNKMEFIVSKRLARNVRELLSW